MSLSTDAWASAWMLVSALFYSLQNAGVVFSGEGVGFWTVCACRGAVGSLLMFFFCLRDWQWCPRSWRLLLLRSVLGGLTVVSLFFAVLRCGVATTTVLTSTSPLWAALLAPKDQRWACRDVVLGAVCVVGVVLVMLGRVHYDRSFYTGAASALASAVFQAGVNLTVRGMRDDSPALIALWGMIGSVVLALPGAALEDHHHATLPSRGVVSLVAIGVLSALAQYCKTHALQVAKSASVLVVRHMEVVFSLVLGVLAFHEPVRWNTVAGAGVIVAACVIRSLPPLRPPPPPLPLTLSPLK